MHKMNMKKTLVVTVIILFFSVSIIPSTGTTIVKKSTGGKINELNKSFQKHRDKRIKELHERMFKSKLHSTKKQKY